MKPKSESKNNSSALLLKCCCKFKKGGGQTVCCGNKKQQIQEKWRKKTWEMMSLRNRKAVRPFMEEVTEVRR